MRPSGRAEKGERMARMMGALHRSAPPRSGQVPSFWIRTTHSHTARRLVFLGFLSGQPRLVCSLEMPRRNNCLCVTVSHRILFFLQRDGFKRMDSERGRLYHLPFSRDAASVVSRFLWKQLNELKVKLVLKTFQVRLGIGNVCCIEIDCFLNAHRQIRRRIYRSPSYIQMTL